MTLFFTRMVLLLLIFFDLGQELLVTKDKCAIVDKGKALVAVKVCNMEQMPWGHDSKGLHS